MKTNILFLLTTLFAVQLTSAQILYSENFDFLTLGNVGTDDTGTTPGQGGWCTTSYTYSSPYGGNNDFKIIAEPGRGNVLEVTGPGVALGRNIVEQKGLEQLWDNRIAGNDVLKIEYDFFTGNVVFPSNSTSFWSVLNFVDTTISLRTYYYSYSDLIQVTCNFCNPPPHSLSHILQPTTVPTNTWLKFELYLDYVNEISYFTVPTLGISGVSGWFSLSKLSGIRLTVETIASTQSVHKFDNFVISAVNTVPLSTQEFISSKFSVFPNPANDIVTITNSENIGIEQIKVFDMSGKTIKSQLFNNENEVQLTIEDLAPGIYMLYIKAKEGTAVKKITKK
ncbi:MAG TPA: T9SS type A sorting domain-containing protein [Flavobacterium sp.]|nr:T9SS type A sorting domain-containing protein [Flavobacterium sp.]